MFRKVPHLDNLVFWIGERHMIMHDDLLTHSWGINREQLLLRRMDSGGDMAQIQCDRFLKVNVWSVLRPHNMTDSALSDLHMEAFLKTEADYTDVILASFAMYIICQEGRIKWARDETQLKDFLIAMGTDGLQERLLRFDKVMESPCYY